MIAAGHVRPRKPASAPLAVSALLTLLSACGGRERAVTAEVTSPTPGTPELTALHSRCVEAMVRNACAATDRSTPAKPEASPVVMIAGVGAVDARFYVALRDAGDQMCGQIVQPCNESWEGSACRTARALWPEAPATQGVATLPIPTLR